MPVLFALFCPEINVVNGLFGRMSLGSYGRQTVDSRPNPRSGNRSYRGAPCSRNTAARR